MSVRGGCLCGSVEFEADLPFSKFVKCHCSRCRHATGSAFTANAYVLPHAFRWLSGEDNVAHFDLSTAGSFSTSFCRKCGSSTSVANPCSQPADSTNGTEASRAAMN
jgi:hypothetical protein